NCGAAFRARRGGPDDGFSARNPQDAHVQKAADDEPEEKDACADESRGKHLSNVPHPAQPLKARERASCPKGDLRVGRDAPRKAAARSAARAFIRSAWR